MQRIVAITDPSIAASHAVAWADALAGPLGAEVVTVPADESALEAARPDLVVVGADGARWFPALHLDHPAHELVNHAHWPLAVVPVGADLGVSRLVVGVDGTPASLRALEWASTEAAPLGAEILAVYARPAPVPARVGGGDAGGELSEWLAPLMAAGGEPERLELVGDPVLPLVEAAALQPASAIVLGGRRGADRHRFTVGSVGLRILDQATVAVVVIPPPAG